MAWRKQGEQTAAATAADSPFLQTLQRLRDERLTAAVAVSARDSDSTARTFLFQGRVYAVALEGYEPGLADRMLSAGRITTAQRDELAALARDDVGPVAESRGWISAEDLALLHQEYLLASFGALVSADLTDIAVEDAATTHRLCTLPLDLDPLLDTVAMRAQRTADTWSGLRVWATPATASFQGTGGEVPEALRIPELLALLAELTEPRTLDQAAHALGLTRAEAVQLAAAAMRADVLRAVGTPRLAEVFPDGVETYRVPEQYPLAREIAPAA